MTDIPENKTDFPTPVSSILTARAAEELEEEIKKDLGRSQIDREKALAHLKSLFSGNPQRTQETPQ
jgi:hypothetical protein